MSQRSLLLLTVGIVAMLCGGCVAKSDYLRKQAEVDVLNRNLAAVTAENASIKTQIERLNANLEKLIVERDAINARLAVKTKDEIDRLDADIEKLTAERDEIKTRLAAKEEEMTLAVDKLNGRNAELEGDAQMLRESIDLLKKTKEEMALTIDDLNGKNAALADDKQMLQDNIDLLTKTKEEEVQTVSKTYEDLLAEMKGEVEQGQIAITELKGKLTVDVVDKILFDSGRAEIKPEGLQVLRRVVEILKEVTDKTIRVEGHTDNVPIGGLLAKRYATNWELSAARAITVTRYLEEEGLDPVLLSAAAFGEHQPVADNETPEGRAKNRRIAIILTPKE